MFVKTLNTYVKYPAVQDYTSISTVLITLNSLYALYQVQMLSPRPLSQSGMTTKENRGWKKKRGWAAGLSSLAFIAFYGIKYKASIILDTLRVRKSFLSQDTGGNDAWRQALLCLYCIFCCCNKNGNSIGPANNEPAPVSGPWNDQCEVTSSLAYLALLPPWSNAFQCHLQPESYCGDIITAMTSSLPLGEEKLTIGLLQAASSLPQCLLCPFRSAWLEARGNPLP